MDTLTVAQMDEQLADCITVYCMAALKASGKKNFDEITGAFWRFNYRKDPLIFFSLSLFNSPQERNFLLKKYFDIQLNPIEDSVSSYHEHIINSITKPELPMIFIDRYDMPYDNICFQKFHENHYVLIQGYDEIKDEYHIVDFFTTPSFATVKRTILEKSMRDSFCKEHPMIIGKLGKIQHHFDDSVLSEILQQNVIHMTSGTSLSSGIAGINSLYSDIENRDSYLDDYIKVINIFSKLKHMGTYRQQHAHFINRHFSQPILKQAFNDLDIKWKMVANYLLKAHLTKKEKLIDNSLNHLQEIIKMETDLLPLYKNLFKGVHRL